MAKNKKPTISDIAEKSGYSKTAVSFAFNNPERIGKVARDKILETAKELNYYPDPFARSFSLGEHRSIGFLLPQSMEIVLQNTYTAGLIRGVGSITELHDYTLTLIPPIRSSISNAIKNAPVDALIGLGIFIDKELEEIIKYRSIPLVIIDGVKGNGITLNIDDVAAAELQMSAALSRGHRKITVISLPDNIYALSAPEGIANITNRRLKGYSIALEKFGMSLCDVQIIKTEATIEDGRNFGSAVIEEDMPTCFVCMSDVVAMGVISAIRERGFKCPEDVSVIGFDGIIDKDFTSIDLASICQSPLQKGKKAAELVFDILEGKKVSKDNLISFSFNLGSTLKKV